MGWHMIPTVESLDYGGVDLFIASVPFIVGEFEI
jgi:hypothetical protein